MKNESLLDALARDSAVAIVKRYADEVHDQEALVEAIARLVRHGLEGHVRLYEAQRRKPLEGWSRPGR